MPADTPDPVALADDVLAAKETGPKLPLFVYKDEPGNYPGIESQDETIVMWGIRARDDDGGVRSDGPYDASNYAAYLVLAANAAPVLAAELVRVRGERDRLLAELRLGLDIESLRQYHALSFADPPSFHDADEGVDDLWECSRCVETFMERCKKAVAKIDAGDDARLAAAGERGDAEEPLTLTDAVAKARGGPPPIPFQGFA